MRVIVSLMGGLGNQMFQYAAGRSLACRLGLPLKLDISGFEKDKNREYKLDYFNINAEPTFDAEIREIRRYMAPRPQGSAAVVRWLTRRITERLTKHIIPWHRQDVIREKTFLFDPDFKKINQGCYLRGFWQSEKYFQEIENLIRKEFTFKNKPGGRNREMLEQIQGSESISVHIRRGDYVSNPDARRVYEILGPDYYRQAMQQITARLTSLSRPKPASAAGYPTFYVFSDDIAWARENLPREFPLIFVDHNNVNSDYEDLRLMSRCRHHIIANSSFSWWGAWLGEAAEKQVIAPVAWFSAETMQKKSTGDLIPEGWMRI